MSKSSDIRVQNTKNKRPKSKTIEGSGAAKVRSFVTPLFAAAPKALGEDVVAHTCEVWN